MPKVDNEEPVPDVRSCEIAPIANRRRNEKQRQPITFFSTRRIFSSSAAPAHDSLFTGNSGGSRTLKQVDMDVSWPMTRFRNAVAAGAVTLAEREQVNAVYASYQTAYAEALRDANNNRDTAAPDNVKTLASNVISAIQAIPF